MIDGLPALFAFLPMASRLSATPVESTVQKTDERAPDKSCKPHVVYKWKSKGGLDFTYSLPKGWFAKPGADTDASEKDARSLVVICHGTGLDYRWGHANHSPEVLRPDNVLVSVSGPSPGQGESRLFLGNDEDRKAFRGFLNELRELFDPTRIFIYGHSQGGFFVLDFAGAFPKEIAGVVAHASGAWASSATPKALASIPLVVQHGSSDPVVPYGQSVGTRDAYEKRGLSMQLRRLEFYNHWPNEVRTHEMIAYCDGMSCTTAEHAIAQVRAMLEPKKPDRYQWKTAPAFSAARCVLRRFESGGDFAKADAGVLAVASKLTNAIENHAKLHVTALSKLLKSKSDLMLVSAKARGAKKTIKPWIEWLLACREDFRGVDTFEDFAKSLSLDDVIEAHGKAASKITRSFYNEKDEKRLFRTIVKELPNAFLYDAFPHDFRKRMQDLEERAKEFGIPPKELAAARHLEEYRTGITGGAENYAELLAKFKLP